MRADCLRCGRARKPTQGGRGLCSTCYGWCRRHGTLDDYEPDRRRRSRADVVEDVAELLGQGETAERAAERMSMKPSAIAKALYRAERTDLARGFATLAKRARLDGAR